jgi:recombination protein RecT
MNQVTTQQRQHPVVEFKNNLKRLIDGGELALPSTVSVDAFRNAAIVAVQDNPAILQCDGGSVMKAIRTLAGAGLVPDGREAAIVPFKGKAQAMPMVAGLVKVARNSGKIISLWADVVYEGETLDVWIEDGERKWNHVNEDGSRIDAMSRSGKIRGAYAVAKLSDGSVDFQPMSLDEIEKRRKASANQRGNEPTGIWQQWYEEMARKTVIRNLCKRLPMSTEDVDRIMKEQDAQSEMRDVTPEDQPNLAQRLKEQAQEPEQDNLDPTPAEDEHEPLTGEILDGTQKHWTDLVDTSNAAPMDDGFDDGAKAFKSGAARTDCPEGDDAAAWLLGWDQAKEFADGESA